MCHEIRLPQILTKGLGRYSVYSCIRIHLPPQNITTFIIFTINFICYLYFMYIARRKYTIASINGYLYFNNRVLLNVTEGLRK